MLYITVLKPKNNNNNNNPNIVLLIGVLVNCTSTPEPISKIAQTLIGSFAGTVCMDRGILTLFMFIQFSLYEYIFLYMFIWIHSVWEHEIICSHD